MERLTKDISCIVVYGLQKVLWETLGEGSLAFTSLIGEEVLKVLENEAGLKVEGDGAQDLLNNIGQIFVEKIGLAKSFSSKIDGDTVNMEVEGCYFFNVEEMLAKNNIKPFVCPFMNASTYAMRRNLNVRSKINDVTIDVPSKKCTMQFQMLRK